METRTGPCLCGEPEKVVEENGKQVLVRCPLYVKLVGKHPQTKEPIDEWACAIAWLPILQIENADRMRYVEGEIEALRKESVERGEREVLGFLAVADSIKEFHDEMVREQQIVLKMAGNSQTKEITG